MTSSVVNVSMFCILDVLLSVVCFFVMLQMFVILSTFQGAGIYSKSIKAVEEDIQNVLKRVNELTGIKESDTGLAPPALWDLAADKQTLQSE